MKKPRANHISEMLLKLRDSYDTIEDRQVIIRNLEIQLLDAKKDILEAEEEISRCKLNDGYPKPISDRLDIDTFVEDLKGKVSTRVFKIIFRFGHHNMIYHGEGIHTLDDFMDFVCAPAITIDYDSLHGISDLSKRVVNNLGRLHGVGWGLMWEIYSFIIQNELDTQYIASVKKYIESTKKEE